MIRRDRGLDLARRLGWWSSVRGGVVVLVVLLCLLVPGLTAAPPATAQEEPTPPTDDPTEPVSPLTPPDDAPVDPGHPLVDPVDPELVGAVTEANLRLSELDQEILITIGEIADADAAIEDLEAESADTRARVDATAADIVEAEEEIASIEALLRERLLDAYVAGSRGLETWVETNTRPDVSVGMIRQIIAETLAASDTELAARLSDRRDDLNAQRRRLERREADLAALNGAVTTARAERADLLDDLEGQRDEMAEVAAQAQAALDEALRFISEQLEALAAVGIDGTAGLPPAGFGLDGLPLCEAAGIVVACSISPAVAFMVAAAQADGVTLTGYGWRSTVEQIALRAAHCGGDVFGAPAGACSPPTARPGSSQHEVGLAIDFEHCSSRDTPCFLWLDEHAEAYGFINLSSEPWHWSTTGR